MALEKPEEKYQRMAGNSTRLIDFYIQKLFEVANTRSNIRYIKIEDHYDHFRSHDLLFVKVARRLDFEHPNLKDKLKFDKSKRTITWL